MPKTYTRKHPYYPLRLTLPRLVKNELSAQVLNEQFGTAIISLCAVAFLLTFIGRRISFVDRLCFVWFILCGCIHTILEGYYCLNHKVIVSSNTLLAQVWKEYAIADSRYLTSEPTVLSIECLTAVCLG
jgi:cholestenol delta-isomerase